MVESGLTNSVIYALMCLFSIDYRLPTMLIFA
jgi:hypothetical protein